MIINVPNIMKFTRKSGECIEWTRTITQNGYGQVFDPSCKKVRSVHRVMYELLMGSIPDGMVIDHLCRNRSCINVKHLEVVTSKINVLRGFGTTATNAKKKSCNYGHEYTEENTFYKKHGGRECRACRKRWVS